VPGKTDAVTCADRVFMDGVVHVNVAFAGQYTELARGNAANVRGINYNPSTEFNEHRHLPTLTGVPTQVPGFRNRIVGDVKIQGENLEQLTKVMGSQISLRADEGHPFEVDSIMQMSNNVTFHALEFTSMHLGANGTYGPHSLVHGGELNGDRSITKTGENVTLGAYSVFFGSAIGDNSTVRDRSLVQDSVFPANKVIGPCEVWLNGEFAWKVEWCPK
jgi:carbonic anhydrase/acetyltransferase-like protein (isoleucine patch superfamily)